MKISGRKHGPTPEEDLATFLANYEQHMASLKKNPHAVALGKKGGKRSTPATQSAARKNGQRGGRPEKT